MQPAASHLGGGPGRACPPPPLLLLLAFPQLALLFHPGGLQRLFHLVGFLSEVSAFLIHSKSERVVLVVGGRLGVGGDLRGSSDLGCVDLRDEILKEVAAPQVLNGLGLVMHELMFRHGSFASRFKRTGEEEISYFIRTRGNPKSLAKLAPGRAQAGRP